MAVGTGIGLDLSALDKALKQADLHIKNLTDKTNGLVKSTVNAFQQMAKSGVLPYVESLKQQKKYLDEISKAKGTGTFFDNMRKEAKSTVDEINRVIRSLEQTKRFQQEESGKSAMNFAGSVLNPRGNKSIDNLRAALSKLEAAQNRQNLNTMQGQKNYDRLGHTISRVKEELDKATGSNQRLTEESQKTQSAFKKLSGVITAAFAINTLKRFVNQMITVRGEFELQHKSLQVLIGDVDKANALWDKTVALAVKSPFRVKDLVTYTKNLAAYRVEADKLYETNKMLADISSGLGVDMNRLILAFGQVKAANFLRGTELRQFSEAGVNMLEELAKRFTMLEGRAVSVGEVFERVSKRMVSFRDVEAVLKNLTSEGGTFYQMQEKQSETLKGMIMNLKDSIDLAFNEMGESTESVTKKAVNAVRNLVDNWEKFKPVISGITVALVSTLVGVGVAKVVKGFQLAGQAIKEVFTLIKTGTMAASAGAGPWVALFAVVTGVVVAITQALGSVNRLQKELNKIYAEDTGNLDKSIARYQDLVNRLREANKGSQERRDIVEKLNNEYGQYLDFIVTEQTKIEQLVNSYDLLVKRMKEKAAAATYEKAFAEISDQYAKKILSAQKDFEKVLTGENFFMNEIPLEAYGLMRRGKNLFGGETAASIIPTKQEINDLYSLLEQRLEKVSAEEEKQLKKVKAQKELINSIVASYYGKEYFLRFAEGDKEIELIETILEKKEKEREIEEQISRAYKESLNSREARLAYDKLELEYTQKQAEVRAMPDKSQFEVNKMLNKLREEFELNKIEIKFKFGQIGDEERNRLRNSILNWATDTTKNVNNEIRRQLSNFMSEEEWSNFLITPDQQAQGISGIIKEITNGYETQMGVIKEQVSLKSAGRKIDEKGLEYAQKQAKAYKAVADILGIELKIQDRISEELRKQINDLMPEKQMISLEDSYKSVKEIQEETNKEYKAQVEVMTSLINQKRAGIDIDGSALDMAREDLEMLREKMRLLGMKVDKPMSETTRNSINYFLPEEFKISDVDALGGITKVNQEAAKAFEDAQKELATLLKMQDQQVEGLEDEILLLESQLPYLQRKVELTGTEIKDRLSELQLLEINVQLSEEYQLDEINLYKDRSTIISEIQAKEKKVTDMIRATKDMRKEGLTIEDGYLEKLQEEYLAYKAILDLIDPSAEEPIDLQRMHDINAKLETDYWIDVIDSQKSEVTLLQEANTEKEKAIAYEAQLLAMQNQGITVTDEQLALAKKDVEQWTLRWKLLGGTEKEKGSRHNSLYDERIKVIDDMNKKYRELAKTLPDVEAKQGAFNAYIDAFAEAYKDIKWIPANVRGMTPEQFAEQVLNFPDEDALVAFLDKLAKEPMKAFEKIKVELAKGEYVLDAKVRVKKEGDKAILDDIQELFDQYDLSVELKKLNIPKDLAKSLFDVDYLDLDGLKKAVQDQEAKFIGADMEDEYKKFLEKIDDLEDKQQLERLKKYIEYAKKGVSERAKIKLEELKKLQEIEETFKVEEGDSAEVKAQKEDVSKRASENVRKESQKAMNKLEWEEFEKSDTFINIFDDIDNASTTLLNHMIGRLEEFKEQWKDMPLEDVNKIIEKLNILQEKLAKAKPSEAAKRARDEIKAARGQIKMEGIEKIEFEDKEAKELAKKRGKGGFFAAMDEEQAYQDQQKEAAQEQISLLETALRIKEGTATASDKVLQEEAKIKDILKLSGDELKGQLKTQQGIVSNADKQNGKIQKARQNQKNLTAAQKAQYDAIKDSVDMANDLYSAFKELVEVLDADDPAMVFADMGMNILSSIPTMLTLIAQIHAATIAAEGLGAAMNMAMGIVGLIVMAIQLLVQAISAAVNYAEKMRQMKLDVLAGQVDNLKKKYDALAESIEKAWSYKQLEEYSKELDKVQKKMISAQKQYVQLLRSGKGAEEIIATAEQAQRKLDAGLSVDDLSNKERKALLSEEYQDYKDATEALAEMQKDYEEQKQDLLDELGGVTDPKEAAEEFVDAWLDAYKETGDGLSGLDEKFDEFFENLIKKKAAMLVAEKALTGWIKAVNNALDKDSEGREDITKEEQEAINKAAEEAKEKANRLLLGIFEGMDFSEADGLSGLQKGIQGMSAEQAEILTAYWNSVRGYTASIDSKMDLILANMGVGSENNPMLDQLIAQTSVLNNIYSFLKSMTTSAPRESQFSGLIWKSSM